MPSTGAPESPVDAAIAAQMMLALDKYESLTRQRNAAPGAAPAATPAAGNAPGPATPGSLFDNRF
jgi:hypothetical protein